jgi:acetylornithine deacetylase
MKFMNDPLHEIGSQAPAMRALLADTLRIPSISGHEAAMTRFVADYLSNAGLQTDLWETDESALAAHPVAAAKHIPLVGRPTLVATLPGNGTGRSLIFNAHSDVVPAPGPERWTRPPFGGESIGDRFIGRGACDVKGPLVSAIWAILAIKNSGIVLPGSVLLELVPGEEDCVTLGTLTSVVRGHTADGCIVLEPTEGFPRNASRPGLRFQIECTGRSVHGTVKWTGDDAIRSARIVLDGLEDLEERWNDRSADPLFAGYPITRPVTVDRIDGGDWQGMVADRCTIAGYLELLPGDDIAQRMAQFERELKQLVDCNGGIGGQVRVRFVEQYAGHHTVTTDPLCRIAEKAWGKVGDRPLQWAAFNSGCEAGLRANLLGTPTLVWGPGSLSTGHALDEHVEFDQVEFVARTFVEMIFGWCSDDAGV